MTGKLRIGRWAIGTAVFSIATMAMAQRPETAGPAIGAEEAPDQIVVTGRKREERLQDVPEAITAFTSASIEAAAIDNIRDVALNVPNFSISSAEQPGIVLINIRGVGQVRNGEPPIAVVIDGVQLNNVNQFTQDLFDIERIEVLKGPQGAVYGRNAIAGALNIVTRQPTNELEGMVEGTIGTGSDLRARAAISGPIVADKLLFRLSGAVRDFDGDIRNVTVGKDINNDKSYSFRGSLIAHPSEALTIDIRGSRTENHSGAAWYSFVPPGARRTDLLPITADIPGKVDRYLHDASVKIDYEFPGATLTSVSAYTRTKFFLNEDFDFLPFDYLSGTQGFKSDAWSQELRLTSDPGRFNWMAGAYLIKTDQKLDSTLYVRPGAGGVLFPFPIPAPTVFTATRSTDDNFAYAFFGQANYSATDALDLSLGLRYDIDERKQTDRALPGLPRYDKTFKAFQPKLAITYKLTPDANLYASAGKGFRSGGFNPNARITRVYKAEENWSFETGFKSTWLDRKLTLNGALFYTRVKDRQIYLFDQLTGSQIITNPIPRSRIFGAELEMTARPADGLDISLSGGFLDTKVTRYDTTVFAGLPAAGDFTGNDLPQVPRWSYSAAVQYRIPLGADTDLTPRIEANGKGGHYYWEVDNRDRLNFVNLVNARLSLRTGPVTLTAYVENLFDKEYLIDVVAQRFSGAPLGDYNQRSWGRRYGLTGRFNF